MSRKQTFFIIDLDRQPIKRIVCTPEVTLAWLTCLNGQEVLTEEQFYAEQSVGTFHHKDNIRTRTKKRLQTIQN